MPLILCIYTYIDLKIIGLHHVRSNRNTPRLPRQELMSGQDGVLTRLDRFQEGAAGQERGRELSERDLI